MSSSSSQGKGKSASVSGSRNREDDDQGENHGHRDGVTVRGGRGDQVLTGTAGADHIKGAGGNDTIDGLAGDDELKGNTGDDTIHGGAGRDEIKGGTGNDIVDGGAGSDEVEAGSGNDVAVYVMSENTGAKDEYDGGSGVDTLRLVFTREEWMRADVQADIARYLAFLAANTNPSGQANGHEFEFTAFGLEVEKFEKLEVVVDGQFLDPRDELADAIDDAAQADEDGSVSGNVLANDSVPDLVRSVELVTGPAQGELTFNPDGSYTYVPGANFNSLAQGETATEAFTYRVTDADGDADTATVTITITGTNDGPVVTSVAQAGAVQEDVVVSASGQVTSSDVDNGATATYSGSANGAYGSFAVDSATGVWTYTLDNAGAATQALAAGQSVDEVFTVTVTDDQGATATQDVTVTITGTNDGPVVASADVTGAVTEAVAPAGTLSDSGTIVFSDLDVADVHSVGPVTSSSGALGTLTAAVTTDTTGSGAGGLVTWNYSVDANAVEYLAAGQTKVESFTFDVSDGHGGTIARTVSVTLTGTNDAPVITAADASGAVAAVSLAPEAPPQPLTFTVQQFLGFQSNDLNTLRNYATTHTANYTVQTNVIDYTDDPGGFAGELPGSNRWPAAEAQNAVGTGGVNNVFFARITADFSVSTADTYTFRTFNDDGVFLLIDNQLIISDTGYHPEAPFQGSIALAPGNHTIELFFYENGGEASLEFSARNSTGSFGLVGANGGGLGGAVSQVTDSGVIAFSDVDLTDAHVVSAAPLGATLGTLTAVENADTTGTGTGGHVTWTYNVSNSAIAYLGEGETKVESFTVTVNDQHGGAVTQQVDVTITGTNDGPAITGGVSTGAVTEDGASTASGQLIALDPDVNDSHIWTVVGGTSSGDASYQFRADSFTVIRNGSTFFQDDFSDGVAPPSAPAYAGTSGYTGIGVNAGALSESGGKLVFDSDAAILFEGVGTADPIVGGNAILRTNIDPANLNSGLKSNANFSIQAVFDLVLPDSPRESYGIRATDRLVGGPGTPADQVGDDVIELMVRESLTGKLQVALREIDHVADSVTNLQVLALDPPAGADQIRLKLDHSTSDVGALHASFEFLSAGTVVGSQAFTAVGRMFGTETPGDTSDDENWTRAEILARAPLHDDSVLTGQYGNLNVNQSGEWTYTLDNGRSATQNLAAGETVTDAFTVHVADGHGGTDTQAITVTVTGTNDAPIVLTPPVARTMGEDGIAHQLTATGLMQFDDVDLTDTHTVSAALQSASVTGGVGLPAGLQAALSGALTTALTNPAQDGHGELQWNFALNDAATQFLNAGQTLTAVYEVAVSDGAASGTRTVTVNITGANDNPVAANDADALTVTSLASQVQTNVVNWVDWTSVSANTVSGTINVGNGQTVGVTYSGEYYFTQTNGGTNYYNLQNGTVPAGTYTSAAVANGPTGSDIIALSKATQKTLTFSQPVDNLFFAVVSLNGMDGGVNNGYLFDHDFQIVSSGAGYFGTGAATKINLPDGRFELLSTYNTTPQLREFHGVVQIEGSVQSLTWTSLAAETWNGFTIGTYGKPLTATATGNVLANDSDPESDPILVTAVNGNAIVGNSITLNLASGAEVTVNKNGTYLYDENGAFGSLGQGQTTQDSFQYTVTDSLGAQSTATVTINVSGTNDGPKALNDSASTEEDTVLSVSAANGVLSNDSDVDGDALTVVNPGQITSAHGATVVLNADGSYSYDARFAAALQALNDGQSLDDTFTYTVSDGHGGTAAGTVMVHVLGQDDNHAPMITAQDLIGNVSELAGTAGDGANAVLSGWNGLPMLVTGIRDQNGDGVLDSATFVSPSTGSNVSSGLAVGDFNGDGRADFITASESTNTPYYLHYGLGDPNSDGVPDFGTATVARVQNTYADSVAAADFNGDGRLDFVVGTAAQEELFINRGDTNGDGVLEFSASLLASPTTSQWTYGIAAGDFNGDGRADIMATNWSSGPTYVLVNQGDGNNDQVPEFTATTLPGTNTALGVALGDLNGDGRLDAFVGRWNGADDYVHINLGDTDGDAKPNFDTYTIAGTLGWTLGVSIADIDGDGRQDAIGFNRDGTVKINYNRGDVNGDGRPDFTTVTLSGRNSYGGDVGDINNDGRPDLLIPDLGSGLWVATNRGDLTGDGLPEFSALQWIAGTTSTWDVALLGTSGVLTDSGTISFNDVDTTDVHVVSANGTPVGSVLGSLTAVLSQDTTGTGTGGLVTWTYKVANTAVDSLAAGQTRVESFNITLDDQRGGVVTRQVDVTIAGTNDAPKAMNDVASTSEDTPVTIAVLANDTDVDTGDVKTLLSASGAQHGTVAVSGGNVVYTPSANYNGGDAFTYTMKDAAGATSTATVNVTVNPVTDSYVLSNLIVNGSFEQGTTGWTTLGDGVDVVHQSGWQSGDGAYSVDLNAFHPGGVQQVLQTTPGVQYTVGFDLSKNPGNTDHATVLVSAADSSQSYTFSAANSSADMQWSQQTFSFTATGTSTMLSFASTYPTDATGGFPVNAQGPALDEVVVVSNKTIDNFSKGAGGDVLQLGDVLASVSAPHDGTAFSGGFVRFLQSGSDTLVQVDADGGGNAYLTLATLTDTLLTQADTANYTL